MDMVSIDQFARASGLTPKALRLYDELGLLRPTTVHPVTGYRFYARSQLERARLVASLRGLGMALARIRVVCELPDADAAVEITSYWRQVEADTDARRKLATSLIELLSREDVGKLLPYKEYELHHASVSERGRTRESQQDAAYAGTYLVAVADGFGAPSSSETAATIAVRALALVARPPSPETLSDTLSAAIADARTAVSRFIAGNRANENAGTTLTAMAWSSNRFALGHVGDSRAYRMRGGELTQLTHDHTFVQSLIDEGRLTPAEASTHPQRTQLLRALSRDGTAEPDIHLREAAVGDRYLLCSKGVHNVLDERRISEVLRNSVSPSDTVAELRLLIDRAGAPDNLSCVVTDVA